MQNDALMHREGLKAKSKITWFLTFFNISYLILIFTHLKLKDKIRCIYSGMKVYNKTLGNNSYLQWHVIKHENRCYVVYRKIILIL